MNGVLPALGGASVTGLTLLQLPPWCVVICVLVWGFLAGLRTVMPQNSHDRLHWWRDRRHHSSTCPTRPPVTSASSREGRPTGAGAPGTGLPARGLDEVWISEASAWDGRQG